MIVACCSVCDVCKVCVVIVLLGLRLYWDVIYSFEVSALVFSVAIGCDLVADGMSGGEKCCNGQGPVS